jgi:hypothetical protein
MSDARLARHARALTRRDGCESIHGLGGAQRTCVELCQWAPVCLDMAGRIDVRSRRKEDRQLTAPDRRLPRHRPSGASNCGVQAPPISPVRRGQGCQDPPPRAAHDLTRTRSRAASCPGPRADRPWPDRCIRGVAQVFDLFQRSGPRAVLRFEVECRLNPCELRSCLNEQWSHFGAVSQAGNIRRTNPSLGRPPRRCRARCWTPRRCAGPGMPEPRIGRLFRQRCRGSCIRPLRSRHLPR